DELRVRAAEQVGAEHEIQPFLRHQARAHPEERRMGARRQTVRLLQRGLAAPLAGEIVDRVVRRDVRVRRRVPGCRVDAVQDPHDPVAQLDELLLQTEPALRRQQLARVGGTDGDLYNPRVFEWYGRMNILKGGLTFADMAVTVSPTHARELLTPEGGFGLQEKFIELGDRVAGILNGIDAEAWNPETDPHIPANYNIDDLAGKRRCKAALQRAYGLAPGAHTPLFGMSARLVSQKGLDIVLGGWAGCTTASRMGRPVFCSTPTSRPRWSRRCKARWPAFTTAPRGGRLCGARWPSSSGGTAPRPAIWTSTGALSRSAPRRADR